ncbi:AraC family transcriptional regulator [Longimicrobium terrae]|uniref:AraC-like DNA-binding protein n=1 Tax=Longimicrobium terrae TaxID=1639882 RepID=A0A841H5Z3_9BACT|nr:helix-turn-helix domain-containing protein [Longimicrobium terrae]MBB4639250.1 AraC-like DNA-binding protein [Longimicrobium terrae]MBB6073490.1 AraC-like DNA-binding protein [Longimicrobium terrae]NNC32260.1 AraC family transcriptional regulator [Longimicrobium terrae]
MTATRYREHTPPAVLAPFVDCIWTLRSEAAIDAPVRSRVLPDGCVDIILDFGDHPATDRRPLRSYLVGAMTRAVTVDQAGRVDMLAVRFRPGGASAFLRVPLGEVTDHAVDVDALGERWGAPASRIHAADSAEERMALLEQELLLRLRHAEDVDGTAAHVWSRLEQTAGALTVRQMAGEMGFGERRLQRLFHDRVGLSPKEAARVARFRTALAHMRRTPNRPLGRIALDSGYYDQPHFNREFARMAGVAPAAWMRERAASAPAPDPAG